MFPSIVRLDVWGVHGLGVPRAFLRMGTGRVLLRRLRPGPQFAKLLGTGSGETFTMRDSDPRHWALLTTWAGAEEAEALAPLLESWARISDEHAVFTMTPIASHGRWAGSEPFATTAEARAAARERDGPVAAITRARIRPAEWIRFWRSVPPVSADLKQDPAVMFTLGIGEAPVGLQGTFSMWRNAQAIQDFAYRRPAHTSVIEATRERKWYAEELFARFAVLGVQGSYGGLPVPGAPR